MNLLGAFNRVLRRSKKPESWFLGQTSLCST
jgi:hypothetical protein